MRALSTYESVTQEKIDKRFSQACHGVPLGKLAITLKTCGVALSFTSS